MTIDSALMLVLREASSCEGTSYLTWRDKIKKVCKKLVMVLHTH